MIVAYASFEVRIPTIFSEAGLGTGAGAGLMTSVLALSLLVFAGRLGEGLQ